MRTMWAMSLPGLKWIFRAPSTSSIIVSYPRMSSGIYVGSPWIRSNLASIAIAHALTRSVLPVPVGPLNITCGWRSAFAWLNLSVYGSNVKSAHDRILAASSNPYSHFVDSAWNRWTTSLARSRSTAGLVSTVMSQVSQLRVHRYGPTERNSDASHRRTNCNRWWITQNRYPHASQWAQQQHLDLAANDLTNSETNCETNIDFTSWRGLKVAPTPSVNDHRRVVAFIKYIIN